MKTKTIIVLLSLFFLLAGLQCPKDKNDQGNPNAELQLPPITSEGKNTVGCKIDGKIWIPYSKNQFPKIMASIDRSANWRFGFWGYQIDNPTNQKGTIGFYLNYINTDTIFILSNNKYNNIAYYYPTDSTLLTTDNNLQNYVQIISFDSINQIISGTFSFTTLDTITNEKHEITDGRFDLRFAY